MNDFIEVAIVEDEDDIRDALRILIGGSPGFKCNLVFASAEEALKMLPLHQPDVIIMDINLNTMNGIDCILALKDKMPKSQFMMCTIYDDDDNIFKALQSGASGYILKRTPPAQILEAIKDLQQGGSPMNNEIARRVVQSFQRKSKFSIHTENLTSREKEILDFLAKGFLYKEIADKLFISKETVKKHIHNIYVKLQVQTRTEALNKAFR
jgi:DNA-binding NarL/FixJ family response regulator